MVSQSMGTRVMWDIERVDNLVGRYHHSDVVDKGNVHGENGERHGMMRALGQYHHSPTHGNVNSDDDSPAVAVAGYDEMCWSTVRNVIG